MKCYTCGSQSWCVNNEGDVQERLLCYDCDARAEMLEEEHFEAAVAAYEEDLWCPEDGGYCPCGSPSCDGTCDSNIRDVEVDYNTSNECSDHNNFEGNCPF